MRYLVALSSIPARNACRCGMISFLAIFLSASLAATPAPAEFTVADFVAMPTSTYTPEFIWTGSELYASYGAIGTNFGIPNSGDGELDVSLQHSPGLIVQTPFLVNGIPGGVVTGNNTTAFYDATLLLTGSGVPIHGLAADGNAVVAGNLVVQPLAGGDFQIWSTDPFEAVDEENPVLLLSGTISDASIVGIRNSSVGSVLSATVTYTDGAILDAIDLGSITGNFTWSLSLISGKFSVNSTTHQLNTFEANGTGQFDAVPEPGSFALLCIGGLGLAGYALRRRHG